MPRRSVCLVLCLLLCAVPTVAAQRHAQPNVVWITIDDISPDFACYGNAHTHTPNLDALAARGQRFEHHYVTTPVCSPVRSALITGCYATTIGAHQHRSSVDLPAPYQPLPVLLRDAGYRPTTLPWDRVDLEAYLTGEHAPGRMSLSHSNLKTDFNFWREGNRQRAMFENWDAGDDRPFFAMVDFNPQKGPDRRARRWAEATGHTVDPAAVELSPFWPDSEAMRVRYATYLEAVSWLDDQIGRVLRWLEDEGLAENTVVFVWGDHGLAFLRHKQWCTDTGLRVPLIVAGPGIEAGVVRDELTSSIDLAATTLELAGVEQPAWMEGVSFLRDDDYEPRAMVFASRDRCDETEERVRAVRDARFKLIWNLRPELSYLGRNHYTYRAFLEEPVVFELAANAEMPPAVASMMVATKPVWELYDTHADPLELTNLAEDEAYTDDLRRLQRALLAWVAETDAGNVYPERMATIVPDNARRGVIDARAGGPGYVPPWRSDFAGE